jgi:hypothetical protein
VGRRTAAAPSLTGVRPADTTILGNAPATGCAVALPGIAPPPLTRRR